VLLAKIFGAISVLAATPTMTVNVVQTHEHVYALFRITLNLTKRNFGARRLVVSYVFCTLRMTPNSNFMRSGSCWRSHSGIGVATYCRGGATNTRIVIAVQLVISRQEAEVIVIAVILL